MSEIKRRYEDVLNKLITKKLSLTDFEQIFESEKEEIKTLVYFK